MHRMSPPTLFFVCLFVTFFFVFLLCLLQLDVFYKKKSVATFISSQMERKEILTGQQDRDANEENDLRSLLSALLISKASQT